MAFTVPLAMELLSTQTVELADRLDALIVHRGYRRMFVAAKAGIRPDALSGLVGGYRKLTPYYAGRLAPVLGVPAGYLLGMEELPEAGDAA